MTDETSKRLRLLLPWTREEVNLEFIWCIN